MRIAVGIFAMLYCAASVTFAAETAAAPRRSNDSRRGDRMIAAYFANETRALADACLAEINSWDDWLARRDDYRRQLREMIALDPLPERTPLRPVTTGTLDHGDFTVENVYFQSRPQLYVTGNLYLPKNREKPSPAVLYVCGHSKAVEDGVSYGNKTKYQQHGAWFARNGYVCLMIDTLQLGEIEGEHHGTYRQNMWWWNARGYTPAGVETWNSIRALDYLEQRPEVDKTRLGVTGRSGGGAYSWYLAALDDRIKCLVPVAGITNLQNHVVDGCVEGHCDCMYFVNTYRWDYAQLAALSAPKPVLLANSDQDHIFPLDGVLDIHEHLRRLYTLGDARKNLGLHITVGPHKDTQVLQLHAFQWFNHHLKNEDAPITDVAEKFFTPQELKVFDVIPDDQINTRVQEVFTPPTPEAVVPDSDDAWQSQRDAWLTALRKKSFAGWPGEEPSAAAPPTVREMLHAEAAGVDLRGYDFESQHDCTLRLYVLRPSASHTTKSITLEPLDTQGWQTLVAGLRSKFDAELIDDVHADPDGKKFEAWAKRIQAGESLAFVAPRGEGPTAWNPKRLEQVHIRRRFMLLGQTLDAMRVWDVRRALQTLRSVEGIRNAPHRLRARGPMSGIALYAALFEPEIDEVDLSDLPASHLEGPDFLNVLRILDVPQTVAMVAENTQVRLRTTDDSPWQYPIAVAKSLDFDRPIEFRP